MKNKLLLSEGENMLVTLPSIDCILGDKLTAFAPHTTGIPFGFGKELEIVKQMYDCWTLFQKMNDFNEMPPCPPVRAVPRGMKASGPARAL